MRVKMTVHTGFAGAAHEETVEITPEDLEGTTLDEYCEQYLQDMIANCIIAGYKEAATNDTALKTARYEDRPATEDEIAFGRDAWIYCSQHMRPHQTGWCSLRDKVGLGVSTGEEAYAKCRAWGFALYADLET